jgi:hypothetical protein
MIHHEESFQEDRFARETKEVNQKRMFKDANRGFPSLADRRRQTEVVIRRTEDYEIPRRVWEDMSTGQSEKA